MEEVFQRIAEEHEFRIDKMEVTEDHVHILVKVPPRHSPAQVVQILKSVSGREVFKKFPKLRKEVWVGEFLSDGYFVRSVGDKDTGDLIRKCIEYQIHEETSLQLSMFEKS